MQSVPNDLLVKIFSALAINEIILCQITCKSLHQQNYEELWKEKCNEFGIDSDQGSDFESLIKMRFKSLGLWLQGKYSIKQITSTDLLPYNNVDQRTSVALHGDNIVWAYCTGTIALRNQEDKLLDQIKVHTTQIWWILVEGDYIYSVAMENPTIGVTKINGEKLEIVTTISTDLDGQKMWVVCTTEEYIVAGDSGGFIYFWKKANFEFVKKFKLPSGLFSILYNSGVFIGGVVLTNELLTFDFEGKIIKTEKINDFTGSIHSYSKDKFIAASDNEVIFKSTNDFQEFLPRLPPSELLRDEIVCHESLIWTFNSEKDKVDQSIIVTVYNKFTQKELFSFKLNPTGTKQAIQRTRIYEIGVRHDLVVFACGGFSYIMRVDEKLESVSKEKGCVIS